MKEDYTKIASKCLTFEIILLTLPKLSLPHSDAGETGHLCTRTDSDVQEVESGSSTLMMTEPGLSEFTPCYGVDSSFMFSSSSGFARTLLSENVDDSPRRPFAVPCAGNTLVGTNDKKSIYMKKTFLLLALCILSAMVFSQNNGTTAQITATNDGPVYDKVEQAPQFPGGDEALEQWKRQHIVYPEKAIDNSKEGQVVVRFIIRETGEVTDAEILRSISHELDEEALRLVSSMPKWRPGRQGGKAVSVRWDEPVTFTFPTAEEIAEMKREKEEAELKVFDVVEEQPSFPGGQIALKQWLRDNTKYPEEVGENGIEGKVIVQFVVRSTGEITDVKVLRRVDPLLDEEAVRITKSMPKWIPGKQNGTVVNVRYTMPVTFEVQ